MADLRLLRPTGSRTYQERLVQAPDGAPWWVPGLVLGLPILAQPVDREGLAVVPVIHAEHLPGTIEPQPFLSRVVERPELLSAVVGRDVTSRDRRRGLRLRERTTNEEKHFIPIVRFDLRPLNDVDAPQLREAQLLFREQPALFDDDAPNALDGCAAVKVGDAVRIGGLGSAIVLESHLPNLRFRDQGVADERLEAGLPSVDVTPVARG